MKKHVRDSRAICSFVPDFIWQHVAHHGTAEERHLAVETMAADHALRAARIHAMLTGMTARWAANSPWLVVSGLRRTIADAKHSWDTDDLPTVRAEGDPPVKDAAVNEAYDGLGATYDFYKHIYRRNSIDGKGLALDGVVHYGSRYDNAMWNGDAMIFGDGDGRIFKRFTLGLDVIGHELTHGVTEATAGLYYFNQSGALNESVSDVFGALIRQYQRRQTVEQADWLVGAEVIGPAVMGKALRSISHPGTAYTDLFGHKDPQPDHMKHYVKTTMDNGGVHINSGIPNRAFYLVASELGGFAWDRAGLIWYRSLRHPRLVPAASFGLFASVTLEVAQKLYGVRSTEAKAVRHAWRTVGVEMSDTSLDLAA